MTVALGRVQPEIEQRAQSLVAVEHRYRDELTVLFAWSAWRRTHDAELRRLSRPEFEPAGYHFAPCGFIEELQPSEYHVVPHGQIKAWADGEIPWSDVGMINGLASNE